MWQFYSFTQWTKATLSLDFPSVHFWVAFLTMETVVWQTSKLKVQLLVRFTRFLQCFQLHLRYLRLPLRERIQPERKRATSHAATVGNTTEVKQKGSAWAEHHQLGRGQRSSARRQRTTTERSRRKDTQPLQPASVGSQKPVLVLLEAKLLAYSLPRLCKLFITVLSLRPHWQGLYCTWGFLWTHQVEMMN